MPRRIIKRYLPDQKAVQKQRWLQMFGTLLHDPNLWHLNHRSVSGALGIGVFNAFLPVPFQTLLSACMAIWLRVNLPIAVMMVWITNPLTIPPMFYMTYRLGAWMLSMPVEPFHIEISADWLLHQAETILPPLLLGSLTAGTVLGLSAFYGSRMLWNWYVRRQRRLTLFRRHQARQAAINRPRDEA